MPSNGPEGAAAGGAATAPAAARWRAALGRGAVLGLSALFFLRVAQFIPPVYTVAGVQPEEFAWRREFTRQVDGLKARLDPAGRVFLVLMEDPDGYEWFRTSYELLPWQADYSYSGHMEKKENQDDGTTLTTEVTPEEWAEYLLESGCTTVFIGSADAYFIDTFGGLFSDGMAAWRAGETDLYAVRQAGGGVSLVPIESEVAGG